jgi:5-methylcytosine-specific restriction protein A
MPTRPPLHRPPGAERRPAEHYDRFRGSAASRGYDRAWRKVRLAYLNEHPLCVECLAQGLLVAAEEVDHIATIEDRPDLRLDPTNLRSLCKPHHSARTARDQAARGR